MPRLARRPRGGFLEDAAVLTAGNVLSQAIWIGSAPILTRLYEPDAFGVWVLFTAIAVILTNITTWRYELAIVLPEKDGDAAHVIMLCLVLTLLSIALTTFIVFAFSARLAILLSIGTAPLFFAFVPVLMSAAAIQRICQFMAVRGRQFTAVARFLILQAGLVVGLQIAFALSGQSGPLQLLGASAIGNLIAATVFVRAVFGEKLYAQMKAALQHPHLVVANAYRYRNFPLYSAPYSLLGIATQRLLFVLLATFASAETVGFFGLAMRTIYLPVFVVAGAFSQAFFRRARSGLGGGGVEHLVHQVLMYQVTFATPVAVLFILNSEPLFAVVFGEGWRAAGGYAGLLAVPGLLLLFTAWLDRIYDIMGRQRLSLVLEVMYGVAMFSGLAISLWLDRGPYLVVATFAGITAIYQVVWAVVTFRIAGFSPRSLLAVLIRLCALAGVTISIDTVLLWALPPLGYVLGCFGFLVLFTCGAFVKLSRVAFGGADSER